MAILIGLSILLEIFALIWLMRVRRWKSWTLMLAVFVCVFLVFHLYFSGPLDVDDNGIPIITGSMIYSTIGFTLLAVCLFVSAISLLLDGNGNDQTITNDVASTPQSPLPTSHP